MIPKIVPEIDTARVLRRLNQLSEEIKQLRARIDEAPAGDAADGHFESQRMADEPPRSPRA